MVICCVTKMVTTCSQMTGHLFDTMIVPKTGYNETKSTVSLGNG